MTEHYDVVIIGGAAIGSSTAFFLSRQPGFDGRILVIERDPTYSRCSTTLSVASIRQQFSAPVNIQMSQFGVEFIKNLPIEFGPDADIGFRENGYLLLASEEGEPILRNNYAIQKEHGANTGWLEPSEISSRFPWLSTDGITAGCFGLSDEGWFDPSTLLNTYKKQACLAGVEYVHGDVTSIVTRNGAATTVRLADGREFGCANLVNAAGPNARRVAEMAGLSIPVEARKRFVYVIDCREKETITNCPLLVDPSGVYVRPEGDYFITGVSPMAENDPECFDLDIEYDLFEEVVWPSLAERIPAFAAIKVINAWAGHYAYNTLDQNAVVGASPDIPNFYFANGFSGHGLQQSPAVGRGLAELITSGKFTTLDLSELAYERIPANKPFREANII